MARDVTGPGPVRGAGARTATSQLAPPAGRFGAAGAGPDRPASYRDLFSVGEYRALWSAQTLSLIGDQFARVAIALLVYRQTGSALLTAAAYSVSFLPPILGGPLLSVLADLFPRRRVMIWCDLLRVPLVLALALPALPFWALCGLLLLTVLAGVPFSAARSAMMPDVLPGDMIVTGSAMSTVTSQVGAIIGFIAGAAVVGALDAYRTLILDAVTFAVSAGIVARWVQPRAVPAGPHRRHDPVRSAARQGARLVFGDATRRTLVLLGWLAGFYMLPEALAVPYAHQLGGGPLSAGLLMAAMPAGTVASAIVMVRRLRPSRRLRSIGWLAMLACAPLTACAASPPFPLVLALWVVSGIGGGYQFAASGAFLQSLPDSGRGAAIGVAQTGILAVQGLGFLLGGLAAQAIGAAPAVAIAGTAGFCAATLLAVSWAHVRARTVPPAPPARQGLPRRPAVPIDVLDQVPPGSGTPGAAPDGRPRGP